MGRGGSTRTARASYGPFSLAVPFPPFPFYFLVSCFLCFLLHDYTFILFIGTLPMDNGSMTLNWWNNNYIYWNTTNECSICLFSTDLLAHRRLIRGASVDGAQCAREEAHIAYFFVHPTVWAHTPVLGFSTPARWCPTASPCRQNVIQQLQQVATIGGSHCNMCNTRSTFATPR
jgi:hypothetical protein